MWSIVAGMLRWLLLTLIALPAHADDAVGRLNIAGYRQREMCTATLIAPDTALTAAHCVTTPEDGYLKRLENMIFIAAWDGATHKGSARIASVEVHPKAYENGRFNLRHDIAVVRLSNRLTPPPMPLGRSGLPGPLTLVGYQRSAPHRQVETDFCYGDENSGLWRIRCRVESGQSGGPVLSGDGATRKLVAVIAAVVEEEALVVPIDNWVRALLTD